MGLELLKNCYLFRDMTPDELTKLEPAVKVQKFNPKNELFGQGDEATSLYIIKHGSVHVLQKASSGDMIEVATLGTGSHFGEMAFLDGEKRSATVEAIEQTEVLCIDYSALREILLKNPGMAVKLYRAMGVFLAGRLRITTNDLSFAREMNLKHF